jgi:hypothetical protein
MFSLSALAHFFNLVAVAFISPDNITITSTTCSILWPSVTDGGTKEEKHNKDGLIIHSNEVRTGCCA